MVKKFFIRCNGSDNTKKLCNFISVARYIDIKHQEPYEKLKNRDWYSTRYWYCINATTTDDSNNDDNIIKVKSASLLG